MNLRLFPRLAPAAFAALVLAAASPAVAQEDAARQALPAPGAAVFDAGVSGRLECKRAPTGHVLVRCSVNGDDAGWFIFDTGAGICVVSTPRVEPLGLKDAGAIEAVGVGGAEQARLVSADALTLGPLTLRDHPMLVTDLSFLKVHLGEEISGVIGFGVLARSVVALDLDEPSVTILASDDASLEDHAWDELTLIGRVPAVRARFEDRDGLFRLDTGANGHVTFHQPAVESLRLLDGRDLEEARLGGVGGFVAAKRGDLAWIELGGVRTEDVPALFATEAKGTFAHTDRTGNIGVELLRPFVLYLDYDRGRIAFVRRG
jgi:hypothetical protein